jgi:Fur family ferric uptake transcriptional regulator
MAKNIIYRCEKNGLRMTEQRRVVAQVLETSNDHPDVEELYFRASKLDPRISIATVYRAVKRYEDADRDHHDHLIDMQTGEVIEFIDPDIEALQEKIAARLGYKLKDHRLELYGVPVKRTKDE